MRMKKLYESLTREPNEIQIVDNKEIKIYFMTDEEKVLVKNKPVYWTFVNHDYKVLVDKNYYDFGVIKQYYAKEVNNEYSKYLEQIKNINKKLFLPSLLAILVLYVILLTVALTVPALQKNSISLIIILAACVLVFISTFLLNRVFTKKIQTIADETTNNIKNILGEELFNQVANDQANYFRSLNPEVTEEENKNDAK